MSPPEVPSVQSLEQQLEELNAGEAERLNEYGEAYVRLKALKTRVSAACTQAGVALLEAMENQGLTRVDFGASVVSIRKRRFLGVAEGADPMAGMHNLDATRAWIEKYNPPQTATTQTAIGQTWEAFLVAEGAAAEMPSFLKEMEVPTLSVRKS